jgi:hypothetical protein
MGVTSILELVPVDVDMNKTEHVAHEHGPQRQQDPELRTMRDFEFQHHDGDEDGDDAVVKSLSPGFPMLSLSSC